MSWSFKTLVQAIVSTVKEPRASAQVIRSLGTDMPERWRLMFLVAVLSGIVQYLWSQQLIALLRGTEAQSLIIFLQASPFAFAFTQLIGLVALVFGTFWVGRLFGGTGDLRDAILLITWLQFILVALKAVEIVAIMVVPFVALLTEVGSLVLFFWLLCNFSAELHGFKSLLAVFFVSVVSLFVFVIVISNLMTIVGTVVVET